MLIFCLAELCTFTCGLKYLFPPDAVTSGTTGTSFSGSSLTRERLVQLKGEGCRAILLFLAG